VSDGESSPAFSARSARLARGGALFAGLLALLWVAGLLRFATLIPDRLADDATPTDAVVVLTGGSGRLDAGLDLLVRGTAGKLFVSGVYRGLDVQRLLQVARPDRSASSSARGDSPARRDPAGLEARVALGNAVDTRANARETAAWMRAEGFRSLRLVTGAYHMPRSLLEFRYALPEATVIPHPVFPEHVKANWWAWPGTLGLVVGEYSKYLFAWTRHRLRDAAAALGGARTGERP
jgi:uncharacterized SAM-binding protein YcdF (DUF218 family)